MCLSKPSMPAVVEPQRPQDAKQADQKAFGSTSANRNNVSAAAGSLLTSPSGVDNKQLNIGRTSLLGQ